jgi:uncharacterized repeat protein (TIGR01451 family)
MSGRRFGKSGSRVHGSGSRGRRLFPERLEERQLLATIQVTSAADSGPGTLRRAILQANQDPEFDRIEFTIPGSGVQTITLGLTPLPALSTPMEIDARTQTGYDGLPMVAIDGTGTAANSDGLILQAGSDGSSVYGLAIGSFGGAGIRIINSDGNVIAANAIGADRLGGGGGNGSSGVVITDASRNVIGGTSIADRNIIVRNGGDGVTISGRSNRNVVSANNIGTGPFSIHLLGNGGRGVNVTGGQSNQIGGPTLAQGNVISANAGAGINISGNGTVATTVLNNYIGLNFNGDDTLPNQGAGIQISGTNFHSIGDAFGNGNIISGNVREGILISNGTSIQIQGNWIGVGSDGVTPFGNGRDGISLTGLTQNVTIGGAAVSADDAALIGNIIANNGTSQTANVPNAGVSVARLATLNSILSNSIYNNIGLGIDLDANSAVDPNDPGDIDSGGNNLLNFPVITSARTGATADARLTQVIGTYSGPANATYRIQFFSSNTGDPSTFGEGQRYLGQTFVTTDRTGNATFSALISRPADDLDPSNTILTATATDALSSQTLVLGNTSEFSAGVVVEPTNVSDLALTRAVVPKVPPQAVTRGQTYTYLLTVTNNGPDDATNVVVTDSLPASWSVQDIQVTGGGTISPRVDGDPITVTFPGLGVGQSATVQVTVIPADAGTFTHTSSVVSDDLDSDLTTNTVSEQVVVNLPIDLGVTFVNPSSDGFTAYTGKQQTYRVMIVNRGEATATNVVMTATVPVGTASIVNVFTGQGNVTIVGNTATLNLSTLAPGLPVYVDIVALIGSGTTTGLTVNLAGDQVDIAPGNNTGTITGSVVPAADLVLSPDSTLLPATIVPGQTVSYRYTIENLGADTATDVGFTMILPANGTFVSGQFANGTPLTVDSTGRIVTGTFGTLPPNTQTTLQVEVLAGDSSDNRFVVSASTASSLADPTPGNAQATTSLPFNPADVSATITGPGAFVALDTPFTYSVAVTNSGPATASRPRLTLTLPAELTPDATTVVAPPGSILSLTGNVLDAFLPSLAPGATFTVSITMASSGSVSRIYNAQAAVILDDSSDPNVPDQYDPDASNNVGLLATTVDGVNLQTSLTAPASPAPLGDTLAFTGTVTSAGPFAARNVTVTHTLPAGAVLVGVQGLSGPDFTFSQSGTTVTLTVPTLSTTPLTYLLLVRPVTVGTSTVTAVATAASQVESTPGDNTASASVELITLTGVVGFESSSITTTDRSSVVPITLVRSAGFTGLVTVQYFVSGGTAVDGVDFTSISGTVTFVDGQTTASVMLPILVNEAITGNRTVELTITGSALGSVTTTTVTIQDTDVDTTAPTVADVLLRGTGRVLTGLSVVFAEALDPTSASDVNNYRLYTPATRNRPAQLVALSAVQYDPATHSVTLTPNGPLAASAGFYTLVVVGSSSPSGVRDQYGNLLEGDFASTFMRAAAINYVDSDGDGVSLRLSGPGMMDVVRAPSGEARSLRITGASPARSVVTGSVRRARGGNGGAFLGNISGLGALNLGATSRLTSPTFTANTPLPTGLVPRSFAARGARNLRG